MPIGEAIFPWPLTPAAVLFKKPEEGGATSQYDRPPITVMYFIQKETGARCLERLLTQEQIDEAKEDPEVLAVGTIEIKIARFPFGFVIGRARGFDPAAPETAEGKRRFEIRKTRRGMAFVRAQREIDLVDIYPRTAADKASGLGDWPLLQGYSYHYGVQVTFSPELDEAFGVGNDKQTVRPIDDFCAFLLIRKSLSTGPFGGRSRSRTGSIKSRARRPQTRPRARPDWPLQYRRSDGPARRSSLRLLPQRTTPSGQLPSARTETCVATLSKSHAVAAGISAFPRPTTRTSSARSR